jgi:hypothetical protein
LPILTESVDNPNATTSTTPACQPGRCCFIFAGTTTQYPWRPYFLAYYNSSLPTPLPATAWWVVGAWVGAPASNQWHDFLASSGGGGTAYTGTDGLGGTGYVTGQWWYFDPDVTNQANATLDINGFGALPLQWNAYECDRQ